MGAGDRVVLVDDWFETGAQALAARALIEETGATLVGMSIVVDDLNNEVRARIGRLHSLLRADAL
jgi:adenine phosphoribosyltransferase